MRVLEPDAPVPVLTHAKRAWQVRTCPETGHEELVVVKGADPEAPSSVSGMLPFALDLQSFTWRRGPWRDVASHVAMPASRQRPGTTRVAGKWLLVAGGTPVPVHHHSPPCVTGLLAGDGGIDSCWWQS